MMSPANAITLVVHFQVSPKYLQEALELFAKHERDGRNDQGNLEFRVFQDRNDPSRFTSVETWVDQEAISAHDSTGHHDEFLTRLEKIQSCEKKVQELRTVSGE